MRLLGLETIVYITVGWEDHVLIARFSFERLLGLSIDTSGSFFGVKLILFALSESVLREVVAQTSLL